jgi:hypothetical protein
MKRFIFTLIFILTVSIWGYSQTVTAPDSKSFLQSTSGQDGSGFTLSGFNSTTTLLTSISLVNPPPGTTFYLTATSGLSPASGFTLSGNKTRLVVTGTMANINTALTSLKINTGSTIGNVQLSVAATVNPAGFFYNGTNGHFYRPISTGTTYTNARTAALNTTFKGQQGYLVTITSADEDQFIFNNVPQSNIWFALTDEVTEGRWVIDAGPERGTVIKTSNGQFTGNIVGQYNNWASGEPNDWGGNEDYAVTKWNGSQWNDLGNGYNNPYVIEYGTWTNPDDATFTEFYTNSVIHTNGEILRAQFNFEFGSSIDKTKFSTKVKRYTNTNWEQTTNALRGLNGLGRVDVTNDLDITKISGNGFKAITTPGQVEWAILNQYDTNRGGHLLQIDQREFDGTGVNPTQISSIKLFDIYDGPVTIIDVTGWWKTYLLLGNLTSKITSTSYSSSLRLQDGWYGTKAEFQFYENLEFKKHGIQLIHSNQTELNNLYNSIVTISDVYLAFRELANGGLFGNETGNEFTNGLQFMNADVDGNGVFNERDTYKLLQHLTGIEPLTEYTTLPYLMKLYNKSEYDGITKSNWSTKLNNTDDFIPFNLNTGTLNNTYNISVGWKGDVNLSHSASQTQPLNLNSFNKNMSLTNNGGSTNVEVYFITELVDDKIHAYLSLNPLQQQVVGTQFQLNYDNSILKFESVNFKTTGNPLNYGTNRETFITLGSLIPDGSTTLDATTEYRVTFSSTENIENVLGLITLGPLEIINKMGITLQTKIK